MKKLGTIVLVIVIAVSLVPWAVRGASAGEPLGAITVTPPLDPFEVTLAPNTSQDYNLTITNNNPATLNYDISDRVTSQAGSPWPMFHHNLQHTGRSLYLGAQTANLKWSYTTDDYIRSSPAIGSDGTIYVGSDDYKLYALNPNGTLKWSYTTDDYIRSSPAIGSDGTIYVGSDDNKLYALNPNGTLKWSYTTGDWIRSSPAIGSDGTIYVGSDDYKLYALNPNGCLLYTSPSPRDATLSRMPSSA